MKMLEEWGISFAVSDDLSISYGEHTHNDVSIGQLMRLMKKTSGMSASYTMGSKSGPGFIQRNS